MTTGRCHCGAVAYEATGESLHHGLCHCEDCRRHSGAPMVAWIAYPASAFAVTQGQAKVYHSSEHGERHFCAECGTGLFYINETALPGLVDIQTATLDDAAAHPPQAHIQVAERLDWMKDADTLPKFERFPGPPD